MEKPQPFFSIVIPTLNEEFFLPMLLSDLKVQSAKIPFEVIVVDGDSQDRTGEVAMEFSESLDIQVVTSQKKGVALQRNLGARQAKGAYLIFIDADTRLQKSFLAKLKNIIEAAKSLIVIPSIIPEKNTPKSYVNDTLFKFSNYVVSVSQIVGKPLTPGACLIFEKAFFHHVGEFLVTKKQEKGELFSEDTELMARSRKAGVIAKYAPDIEVEFSLRRFKKEGRIKVIRNYIISAIEMLTTGEMKSSSIQYEMGGRPYFDTGEEKLSKKEIASNLKILKTAKKLLNDL